METVILVVDLKKLPRKTWGLIAGISVLVGAIAWGVSMIVGGNAEIAWLLAGFMTFIAFNINQTNMTSSHMRRVQQDNQLKTNEFLKNNYNLLFTTEQVSRLANFQSTDVNGHKYQLARPDGSAGLVLTRSPVVNSEIVNQVPIEATTLN